MKYLAPILMFVALASTALPASAQILFTDSFENDGTGYNLPNTSSTPPWNNPIVVNSGGPTEIDAGTIPGQDGNNYLRMGLGGNSTNNSITLTTVNGDAGNFAANTTYTLSFLMQSDLGGGNSDAPQYTGGVLLIDGTTSTTLASNIINISTVNDTNFDLYTLSFDTSTNPSVVNDSIQIGLAATQSSAIPFNQNVKFDDVTLTAAAPVPEPSTWALMGLGLLALVIATRRYNSLA